MWNSVINFIDIPCLKTSLPFICIVYYWIMYGHNFEILTQYVVTSILCFHIYLTGKILHFPFVVKLNLTLVTFTSVSCFWEANRGNISSNICVSSALSKVNPWNHGLALMDLFPLSNEWSRKRWAIISHDALWTFLISHDSSFKSQTPGPMYISSESKKRFTNPSSSLHE